MELEKQRKFLTHAGYWLAVVSAAYLGVRFLLPPALPFIWGFIIAWMLRPAVRFICRHSGMSRRGAAIFSATALYVVLGLLLWFLGSLAVVRLEELVADLPELYTGRIAPLLNEISHRLGVFSRRFARAQGAVGAGGLLTALEQALGSMVASASAWSMQLLGKFCTALPGLLLSLVFMLLSSVLICIDYDAVTGFVMRQIPEQRRDMVLEVRDFLATTVWKVVKAYAILTGIAFAMLGSGLAILGVKGFLGIAATIAVLDLLPIIGSGAVLIPWGIYSILGQNLFLGAGLLALWAVISFVKQLLEPKILGDQIGLSPLLSLISMYAGLRLAGFWGLILAPILCLLLRHLQEKKVIRLFR